MVQLGQRLSFVEYQPHYFALSFPFLLHSSVSVQIERDPTVGRAQKVLHYLRSSLFCVSEVVYVCRKV